MHMNNFSDNIQVKVSISFLQGSRIGCFKRLTDILSTYQ